jgi:hypothetical protein
MKEFYSLSKIFYDFFIKNCKFMDIIVGICSIPIFILVFIFVTLDNLWSWIIKKEKNGQ